MSAICSIEVRYRVAGGDTAWSSPVALPSGATDDIPGLTRGKTYNIQARAYGAGGIPSAWADQPDLVVPLVNDRIRPKNLNTLNIGGIRSAWTGLDISYSASGTDATISCTAGTLQDAGFNPTYAASSTDVSGDADATVNFFLYYDDPDGQGGSFPLHATASYEDLAGGMGRVWVGQVEVTFSSGSSGGGGTGGGGFCPLRTAWVIRRAADGSLEAIRADQVRVGDYLLLVGARWGRVSYSQARLTECVRVRSERGSLGCSTSAPLGTGGGESVLASSAQGREIEAMVGGLQGRDTITQVDSLGLQWVQHITCEDDFFWAGDDTHWFASHHNLKPQKSP